MLWLGQHHHFFPLGSNKISLSQDKKYLGQRQVGPLFTAGQNYARISRNLRYRTYITVSKTKFCLFWFNDDVFLFLFDLDTLKLNLLNFKYGINQAKSSFSKNFLQMLQYQIVMGPGQKFLTRVGSDQALMVWVRIWKISPKNVKFFNFFPFGSKKITSGRVRKYPGQSRVGLLFTAGQK